MIYYFYFRFCVGKKPKKAEKIIYRESFWKRIFIMFPRRLSLDMLERDNNQFQQYGIHIVVGEQGSGKTITMVYLMEEWKRRYPKLKIYTNMFYKHEDGEIIHWKQIIERQNGIYGIVNGLDEIQTWFPSSKASSSVPAPLLGEICQQRKQKKAILGTVQVFSRLSREFREQVRFVYVPKTFLGCFTIVRVSQPKYYNYETNSFRKYSRTFFFVHTNELRDAFDTYKTIEKYKEVEFEKNSTILVGDPSEVPTMSEAEGPDK